MKNAILVFLGGGVGSVLRYLIGCWIPSNPTMFIPVSTLISNLLACFVLGIISGYVILGRYLDPKIVLLFTTGICGGLSTFSTFIGESHQLAVFSHTYMRTLANILLNLVGCFLFYIGGTRLAALIN